MSGGKGGVDYICACHGILEGGFGFHHSDAIFAVVEHKQGVALLHALMFGEIHFLDVACGTHVHRCKILLHLCIVAGFGLLIVEK